MCVMSPNSVGIGETGIVVRLFSNVLRTPSWVWKGCFKPKWPIADMHHWDFFLHPVKMHVNPILCRLENLALGADFMTLFVPPSVIKSLSLKGLRVLGWDLTRGFCYLCCNSCRKSPLPDRVSVMPVRVSCRGFMKIASAYATWCCRTKPETCHTSKSSSFINI